MASRTQSQRRKRQTRLTFTPASSSPAPKSSFVPAFVGYEGSASRPRSPGFLVDKDVKPVITDNPEATSHIMPTPIRSSQMRSNKVEDKVESSASSDTDDTPLVPSSKKRRLGPSKWRDEAHDKLAQPRISKLLTRRQPSDDHSDGAASHSASSPRLMRLSNRRREVKSESEMSDDTQEAFVEAVLSDRSLKPGTRSSRRLRSSASPSAIQPSQPSSITRSGRRINRIQPIVIESSQDSLCEFESPSKANRDLRELEALAEEDRSEASPFPSQSGYGGGEATIRAKNASRFQNLISSEREESSEAPRRTVNMTRRLKPRLSNRRGSPAPVSSRSNRQEEDDEIAEDLDFLRSSSPPVSSSLGKRKLVSARQLAMEQLKRRRAGEAPMTESLRDGDEAQETSSDEDNDGAEQPIEQENGEGSEPGEAEEYRDALDGEIGGPGQWLQGSSRRSRADEVEDEDEDDFIVEDDEVEDDEGILGVPDHVMAPIHLTRYGKMKAKDLFRFIVEWMVQKKLNPAFQIDDELYTLAFNKVEDEINGLVGSKYTSSIWTQDFLYALQGRPDLAVTNLHGQVLCDYCEACNRKSHPASYQMQFTGKPYHPETLEDVEQGSEDEDNADDDEESESSSSGSRSPVPEADASKEVIDAKNRVLPSSGRKFSVGRTCKQNATTAHALHHWRTHLYDHIKEHLHKVGCDTAEAIVKRDRMSTKKRRTYANKIVDQMAEDGVIRKIWRDFRGEIDAARAAK